MKKATNFYVMILCMICSITTLSCDEQKESPAGLTGEWQLTEILADPGDGSGTFRPVDNNKTLTFYANGEVTATNGTLCGMDISATGNQTGTYTVENDRIRLDQCETAGFLYEIERNELIIWYHCIEGCGEKYRRVN